ncbi:hypothetical protein TNCV_2265461 [Trichonephila clavipes]|nr:hypothetical protein TNCV_2265461 [Trichonephila clavipes]
MCFEVAFLPQHALPEREIQDGACCVCTRFGEKTLGGISSRLDKPIGTPIELMELRTIETMPPFKKTRQDGNHYFAFVVCAELANMSFVSYNIANTVAIIREVEVASLSFLSDSGILPKKAGHPDGEASLGYTRIFGDRPRHFEPWSRDEDDT